MADPNQVAALSSLFAGASEETWTPGNTSVNPFATGQNVSGTENFWDKPFLKGFLDAWDGATSAQRATWFEDGRDGIAITSDPSTTDAGAKRYRVGDVFKGGQVIGNVYDAYGDEAGAQIIGSMLPKEAAPSKARNLGELQQIIEQYDAQVAAGSAAYSSRQDYDRQVREQKDEWDDGWETAGAIAAGAAGGVAAGVVGGVGGMVAGGLIGALGGFLNKDEFVDRAAQAKVKAQLASEDDSKAGGIASIGEAVAGYAGVADLAFSPLQNLLRGGADVAWGKVGDDKMEFYEADPETGEANHGLGGTIVNSAAMLGDSFLRMASPVGRGLYSAQLTGQIGGKLTSMVGQGVETFDESTGEFDPIFYNEKGDLDVLAGLAGLGSVGIDVVQLGMMRGMGASAAAAGEVAPTSVLGKVVDKVSGGAAGRPDLVNGVTTSEVLSGMKYTLDDAGKVIDKKFALSIMSPADAVEHLGVRYIAIRANGGRLAGISADDYYQAAKHLGSTSSTWKASLLTGFAEGHEEGVQSVLEAASHGYDVDPKEYLTSFVGGFASGAGMYAGSRYGVTRAKVQTSREDEQIRDFLTAKGYKVPDGYIEQMSPQERRNALTADPKMFDGFVTAANEYALGNISAGFRDQAALEVFSDRITMLKAAEQKKVNDPTDASYRIVQENANLDDHMNGMSINTLVSRLEKKNEGISSQVKSIGEADPRAQGLLSVQTELNGLISSARNVQKNFYAVDQDGKFVHSKAEREQFIRSLNSRMKKMWVVAMDKGVPMTKSAKAVSLLSLRNPVDNPGSFQLSLPQVSLDASFDKADGVIMMTLGPTKSMGADFDGDKITLLTHMIMDDGVFAKLRTGSHRVSSDVLDRIKRDKDGAILSVEPSDNGVMILTTEFEKWTAEVVYQDLQLSADSTIRKSTIRKLGIMEEVLRRNFLNYEHGFYPDAAAEVVDEFIQNLKAGNPDAKGLFFTRLVKDFPQGIQSLAADGLIDPIFAMNSLIRSTMRNIRKYNARARRVETSGGITPNKVNPIDGRTNVREYIRASAATRAQQLDLLLDGEMIFRKFQSLHYSLENSTVVRVLEPGDLRQAYQSLVELYRLSSSGKADDGTETLDGRDSIVSRVSKQLDDVVEIIAAQNGGARLSKLEVAGMYVPDIQENQDGSFSQPRWISMAEYLLQRSIWEERVKPSFEVDLDMQAKVSALENLSPGEAVVKAVEGLTLYEVLGSDSEAFVANNITVGQFVSDYVDLSDETRSDRASALRRHPLYTRKNKSEGRHNLPFHINEVLAKDGNPPVTAYQILVDAMIEAGNKTISWNKKGDDKRKWGKVEGRIGESSNRASDNFRTALNSLFKTVTDYSSKLAGFDRTSGESWAKLLSEAPDIAKSFLQTIPEDLVLLSFDVQDDGTVIPHQWVYDMLTKKTAEEAEMVLLRHSILDTLAAKGGIDVSADANPRDYFNLDDRMHQLMYRLAKDTRVESVGLELFQEKLLTMTNADEFIAWVNNFLRGNEAPYTAWDRDVARIDPVRTKGGWSRALPGSTHREAMGVFMDKAAEFSRRIHEKVEAEESDANTLRLIKTAIENHSKGGSVGDNESLYIQLKTVLEKSSNRVVALGPAALKRSMVGALYGFFGQAVDKGKSAEFFEVNGVYDSMWSISFSSPEEQILNSATTASWNEAATHPTALRKKMRVMDSEGRVIEWEPPTPEKFVEMWETENGKYRPFLRAIFFPSVFEHTRDGKLEQRFLAEPSLSVMLRQEAMHGTLYGESVAAENKYIAQLQSVAEFYKGNKAVESTLSRFLIAQTSSRNSMLSFGEAISTVNTATSEFARVMKVLGRATPETLEDVRKEFERVELAQDDGHFSNMLMQKAAKEAIVARFDELDTLLDEGKLTADEVEAEKNFLEQLNAPTDKARAARMYSLKEYDTPERRQRVFQYLKDHPDANARDRNLEPLSLVLNAPLGSDGLPILTDAKWKKLGDSVVILEISRLAGMAIGGKEVADPTDNGAKNLDLYDPTYSYLWKDLLREDNPLILAARDMAKQYGDAATVDKTQVARELFNTLFDPKKYGPWTDTIVTQTLQTEQRLNASGATQGIQMSGIAHQHVRQVILSTAYTFEDPGDTMLSRVSVSNRALQGPLDAPLTNIVRPSTSKRIGQPTPLRVLDGRFVKNVDVYLTRNGKRNLAIQDVVSWAFAQQLVVDYRDPNAEAPYGSVTVDRLRSFLWDYAKENDLNQDDLEYEITFFHPEDKPVSMVNNLYFDGVGMPGINTFPSLLAAGWFAPGEGFDPTGSTRALSSAKKGLLALLRPNLIPYDQVRLDEKGFEKDLYGVLLRKTQRILSMDIGDGSKLPSIFFNVVMKHYRMRHFIRGIDADGVPKMFSADEIIELQNTGKMPVLTNMELWIPSESILRTMLDDIGDRGELWARTALQDINPMSVTQWTGKLTMEQMAKIPGAFEVDETGSFVKGDILKTAAVNRGSQRVLSDFASIDKATQDKYMQRKLYLQELNQLISKKRLEQTKAVQDKLRETLSTASTQATEAFGGQNTKLLSLPRNVMPIADLSENSRNNFSNSVMSARLDASIREREVMGVVYSHTPLVGPDGTEAFGVVGPNTLDRATKSTDYDSLAPNDLAVVLLDSFVNMAKPQPELRNVLQEFASRGALITIPGGPGTSELRDFAAKILGQQGYHRVAGSHGVFELRHPSENSAAIQAYDNYLTEIRAVPTFNLSTVFQTNSVDLGEQGAWWMDSATGQYWIEVAEDIPVTTWPGFSLVVERTDRQALKQSIQGLRGELIKQSLSYSKGRKKLSKEETASLDHAIENLKNLEESGLYPAGTELHVGDFIPLIHKPTNKIIFTRHGHEAPKPEDFEKFVQDPNSSYLVYSPTINQTATTHSGSISEYHRFGVNGLRVNMMVRGSVFGGKLQIEMNGGKHLPTPPNKGFMLPVGIKNRPINLVVSLDDSISKGVYEGRLDTFRNVFGYLGWDFRPALATHFYGPNYTKDQLDNIGPKLKELQRVLPKLSVEGVLNLMDIHNTPTFVKDLLRTDPVGSILSAARSDWVTKLDNDYNKSSAEALITNKIISYLMLDGSSVDDILYAGGVGDPGMDSRNKYVQLMPRILSQEFDKSPLGSPVRKYAIAMANSRFENQAPAAGQLQTGYVMRDDLKVVIANEKDRGNDVVGYLQFAPVYPSGNEPVLDLMAQDRKNTAQAPQSQMDMAAMMLGAETSTDGALTKTAIEMARAGSQKSLTGREIIELVRNIPENSAAPSQYILRPAERYALNQGRLLSRMWHHRIDTSDWADTRAMTRDDQLKLYNERVSKVIATFKLPTGSEGLVDSWIRQMVGAPVDNTPVEEGGNPGAVNFTKAYDGLKKILENGENHQLPVSGGIVPVMNGYDLQILWNASMKNKSGWKLWSRQGDPSSEVNTWEDWRDTALGFGYDAEANKKFHPGAGPYADAMLTTYRDIGTTVNSVPLSFNTDKVLRLLDPDTNELVLSFSKLKNRLSSDPVIVAMSTKMDDLFGGITNGLTWRGTEPLVEAPSEATEKWGRWGKGLSARSLLTTQKDYAEIGRAMAAEGNSKSALWRTLLNHRVGMATWNPYVWVGGAIDMSMQESLNRFTNFLVGESTGSLAALTGLTSLTPEDIAATKRAVRALGIDTDFKAMLIREMGFDSQASGASWLERKSHKFAKLGGKFQDPTAGVQAHVSARRYVETVTRELRYRGGFHNLTTEMVADRLINDSNWIIKQAPDIHLMGIASVKNMKLMKDNILSRAFKGVMEPLTHAHNPFLAGAANTAMIPLVFTSFATNKAIQVFGLQGPMDLLAMMMLHGRKMGPNSIFARYQAAAMGIEFTGDPVFDVTDMLESADLTNSLIKSGVSLTGLMSLGLLAGGLGLSGEDEEDRRRRKAARFRGYANIADPRDLVNDFRNADAIYLDWLPMADQLFQVTSETDPGDARAMVHMDWLMKSYLNPILGMERFFNTGNPMELWWGMTSAIGAAPLVNTMMIEESGLVFTELQNAALESGSKGDPESLRDSYGFLVKIVMTFEKMLLENNFINMLYQAQDQYDRDPYVMVNRDSTGDITTNKLGIPDKTSATELYVDKETGEVGRAYAKHDSLTAQLRGFAENRATFAFLASIPSGGTESSWIRNNMAAKIREVEKPEINIEEATAHILTMLKAPELLNNTDLSGLYIPYNMREQIAANFYNETLAEAAALELTDYQTSQLWNLRWYGPRDNPDVVGLEEILWSDKISYSASDLYYQLNTTYVKGPDGKMWATGFRRDLLFSAMPFQPYRTDSTDSRLNTVDEVRGINTGLRGLEKVDPSFSNKEKEEESTNPANSGKSSSSSNSGNGYSNNGYTRSGYSGYSRSGGSSGGSKGYGVKLNPPQDQQVPYANTIDSINANNPLLRRATIRRERTDSQKGRLNQWQ